MNGSPSSQGFPTLLQRFFLDRLLNQQNVSKQTVAAYRDTFRLLLNYLQIHRSLVPSALSLGDLNAETVLGFLEYLEQQRGNSIRTRNARLAAIRSFLHYAGSYDPPSLATIQRVLAIPMKRFELPAVVFLSQEEITALLKASDLTTWSGRRDQALFTTLYNTGARVSEIIGARISDLVLDSAASLNLHGKGRKERAIPLWKSTVQCLKHWLNENTADAHRPLFPDARGLQLSRSGVEYRLRLAKQSASESCPSLAAKRISPHILRHTTAMHLLQSGVDLTVIALWLGHESPATTHWYMEADLAMKEAALARLQEPPLSPSRYRPSDKLIQFLETL